ncbi:MAG: hypothetical protein EXR52_06160 [Dehalococcoidia bacterium]|nr:hypothetical protein [Dehalococcoidia bacterium]
MGQAGLGPLALNGGPTGSHALLNGSFAINAGSAAVCASAPIGGVDQRGLARPQGPGCDLGAFESSLAGTIGGRNLKISTGSIDLTWDGGDVQAGYVLLRVNTATNAVVPTPLPSNAVSYSDVSPVSGIAYCYVLLPTGPAGLLGVSDVLCAVSGQASGSPLPAGFTLSLGQSSMATMALTSGGPVENRLVIIPLDGGPITNTVITPGTFTQPVPTVGACFVVLAAGFSNAIGVSNPLCGASGVSTLSTGAKVAALDAVTDQLITLAQALATIARAGPE